MANRASIPKGTRDFNPAEVTKRNYIIDIIKKQFNLYGFQPIETPSFENSETLLGKYGDEGDRLIFKILNSGDFLSKIDDSMLSNRDVSGISNKISEKALRYDLTVPFARYVVQNQNDIDFPFKRYQIQPVWRADRPQKGRFREFFQCDADVIGSTSLWQEVELIQLYDSVFTELGLQSTTIKINNRKILTGIAEIIGASDKIIDFTVALDKLDKIGEEKVKQEMMGRGIPLEGIKQIEPLFSLSGSFDEKLVLLRSILEDSKIGQEGIHELEFVYAAIIKLGLKTSKLKLDVTLARGLEYYTGAIFEVAAPAEVSMGSIGGGGRYDDLTGIFGLKDMSGVGISFGLDRIYLVLDELKLFPERVVENIKVLFINFGESESMKSLITIKKLRENNIAAELYPDDKKTNKQLNYANKRNIPYVVLLGQSEIEDEVFTLKNMKTGSQEKVSFSQLIEKLS